MKPQTMVALILGALLPALAASQEIEPGVQTSSAAAPVQHGQPPPLPAPVPAAPSAAASAASVPSPVPARPAAAARRAADARADTSARSKGTARSKDAAATTTAPARATGKSSDSIQLDTTQISGNEELPKVMYVVPWRRADPGDFAGRPPNSLLDEALTPVDRDVFRRQNRYYGVLQGESRGTPVEPASKDEK